LKLLFVLRRLQVPSGMTPLPDVHFQPDGSFSPVTFLWVTFFAVLQLTFLRFVILKPSTLHVAACEEPTPIDAVTAVAAKAAMNERLMRVLISPT
jgi:hypothetical protein